MATTKKNVSETTQTIVIKPIKRITTTITIVGDSPLIVHAWSEKAKKMMLAAQQKTAKAKVAREARDPFDEFINAAYWISGKPEEPTVEAFEEAIQNGATFGFPVVAVKQAAMNACFRAGLIPNKTMMKASFRINAHKSVAGFDRSELGLIETDEPPVCREDMVRLGGLSNPADLRYRPMFRNWKMKLDVTLIDTGVFSMESIINAINLGGAMNGIGEWRTEKDGDFGQFHVEVE